MCHGEIEGEWAAIPDRKEDVSGARAATDSLFAQGGEVGAACELHIRVAETVVAVDFAAPLLAHQGVVTGVVHVRSTRGAWLGERVGVHGHSQPPADEHRVFTRCEVLKPRGVGHHAQEQRSVLAGLGGQPFPVPSRRARVLRGTGCCVDVR